ncbi:MAG: signal peptide peptidase SppA [Gammaproteobacteria bacterium]
MSEQANQPNWERATIEKVLLEHIREQKRRRRWGIFFKLAILILIVYIIWSGMQGVEHVTHKKRQQHSALIDIRGGLFDGSESNADTIANSLRNAFEDKGTRGIILRINSPGGSPVQASYVFNEIMRLKKLHPDIKVYAVCSDICASAAYYIASASDKIYANPSSLVGSIGVMFNGFGFVDAMDKLGIQRRLFTAGARKDFMDPFLPLNPADAQFIQQLLRTTHQQFIDNVKQGRGNRLVNNPDLFSGLVWSGVQAKQLGLIDDFGSAGYVAREVIKQENIVDYTDKPNVFNQITKRFGASVANTTLTRLGVSDTPLR